MRDESMASKIRRFFATGTRAGQVLAAIQLAVLTVAALTVLFYLVAFIAHAAHVGWKWS